MEGKPMRWAFEGLPSGRARSSAAALSITSRSPRSLVLYFALLAVFGCSLPRPHLHNTRDLALAKEAYDTFDSFRDESKSPYGVMLRNARAMDDLLAKEQAAAAELKVKAVAGALPDKTWEQIRRGIEAQLDTFKSRRLEDADVAARLLEALGEAKDRGAGAAAAYSGLLGELKAAIAAENLWRARGVFFRDSLKEVAQLAGSESIGTEELRSASKRILDQEVEIAVVDEGNPERMRLEKRKLAEVLEADLRDARERLEMGGDDALGELLRAYTIDSVDPEAAPGLSVAILSLALDLAAIERDRQADKVAFLEEAIALMPSRPYEERRLRQALEYLKGLPPNEQVLPSLNAMENARRSADPNSVKRGDGGIRRAARALAAYLISTTLDESAALELDARRAALEHEYTIRQSQLNASEREAVIGRGLGALVTYQEGGIKPEQVAQIIQAAQAVGIAFIAAGVF